MAEGGVGSTKFDRQDTEDITDLPLRVPVAVLYEHFQCAICMSRIKESCITSCGHRFCCKCIEECIDRRHECPLCKAHLKATDMIRDTGFDALLRVLNQEKSKAEKEYFEKVVEEATNAPFRGEKRLESPLQTVLQKHLKLSLKQHEAYHQQLVMDYKKGVGKLGQEKHTLAQQAIQEFPHDPDHPERQARLAEVERRWEEKKQSLTEELARVEKLLAGAYDRYLTEHLPPPSTIPLNITLSVPQKNFTAIDILLRPEENMAAILKKLRSLMEKEGLEIVEFPPCNEFEISIISPFAPVDGGIASELSDSSVGGAASCDNEGSLKEGEGSKSMTLVDQVLHQDCIPVLEFEIKPGTEIRFKGNIVLDSEVPKLCFAAMFVKGQAKPMDYFTCRQCGFNWVCRPCAELCHKDHELVPYAMNHRPTWACCYCPRKKMCQLQGK